MPYMGIYSMEYYTLQFLFLDLGYRISNVYLRWGINFIFCMTICTLLIVVIKKYMPILNKIFLGFVK